MGQKEGRKNSLYLGLNITVTRDIIFLSGNFALFKRLEGRNFKGKVIRKLAEEWSKLKGGRGFISRGIRFLEKYRFESFLFSCCYYSLVKYVILLNTE